jgi:hypothetical protein
MEIRQEYFEEKHDFKRSVLFLSIFFSRGLSLNYGVKFNSLKWTKSYNIPSPENSQENHHLPTTPTSQNNDSSLFIFSSFVLKQNH